MNRFLKFQLLITALICGCSLVGPKLSGEVFVYVVGPMSGEQADGGQSMAGGARLKADEVNRAGGVLGGKKVTIRALNDEADEAVAVEVAKQIEKAVKSGDQVLGVVGHYNSGPTAAALPTYKSLGLVVVSPTSSNPDLTRSGSTNFFRVCASDATQGPTAAQYLAGQGYKNIAVIHTDNSYALGLTKEFTEGLQKIGGKVAVDIRLKVDAPTFARDLAPLASSGADSIFFAGDYPDGINLIKDLRKAGNKLPLLASDANFVDPFVDDLGAMAEGVVLTTISPDPKIVAGKDWHTAYQNLEQRNPGIDSTMGYAAMDVLLSGVKKSNSIDGASLSNAVRGLDLQSLTGRIQFDKGGDVVDQRVYLYRVEKGKFVQISSRS